MNILLISPPLTTTERYGKALGKVGPKTEPLGLAYLAGSIKQTRNDNIQILDAVAEDKTQEDIKKILETTKWDIVGIMILTPMYFRAKETIKNIKQNSPNSKIIVGGAHVTIFPKQTLEENPEIDICVIGEGEQTIVEILNAIEKKKSLKNIKGIIFKEKNKIIKTNPRPINNQLDSLPLPARDLLNMPIYKPAPTYYQRLPSYLMLTSRGCPFQCTYCSKISGRIYRHHSIERIIKEMKILIEQYDAKEIIFRDDTFTVNREHTIKLCNEIINQGLNQKIQWTCMTRVNLVDLELLKIMKNAGCWSIHYGIESGNQRLLDIIKKDITIEQSQNACKWTKEAGIEVKAFFMLGLPTETKEESQKTIDFTKEIDADWIQVTLTVPYPGTELFEITSKEKTLKSFKWEDYQTWAGWADKDLVYVTEGRNQEELKQLQKRAMREFYFRPKFIVKQIKNLTNINSIRTYINGGLALIKK